MKKIGGILFNYKHWAIAIRKRGDKLLFEGDNERPFEVLKYKKRFTYADPYLVTYEDSDWLFYEKQFQGKNGYISALKLDDFCRNDITVLKKPYHLSYPYVFRKGSGYYMIPETGGVDKIILLKCKTFPDNWELDHVLVDKNGVDSNLVYIDGKCFLFTYSEKKLKVYETNDLGKFREKYTSDNDLKLRGGGTIFVHNGNYVRPTQNCNLTYGGSLIFNAIDMYDEFFIHKVIEEVHPCDITVMHDGREVTNIIGVHTYNYNERYEVIDVLINEFSFWALFWKIYIYGLSKIRRKVCRKLYSGK